MKTFYKVLLGCLALPILLLVVLIVVGLTMRLAGPPEHRPETADLEQPIAAVTQEQLAAEGLSGGSAGLAGRAMPVNIWLEEGNFTILPGLPGSGIKVEGNYDAGLYDLKQEMVHDSSGAPSYKLSFRPRYSMLRRIFTEGGVHIDSGDNAMTVYLPRGVPIALNARIRKGASNMHLGGLALESARLDLEMGEHNVTVEEPNPVEMSSLECNVGMGEIDLLQLGNLNAEKITAWGKMGEVQIDMGQRINRDTKLYARMRMGEMTLGLPSDARVRARTTSFLGGTSGHPRGDGEGSGYLLDVDAGSSLGELKYRQN